MSIEFISAKDLPVAEGDEVSVLCLENGEMKQKPGASLGGGYDAVVTVMVTDGEHACELTSGSYDAIRAKVLAGDIPNIKFIFTSGLWHEVNNCSTVQVCEDTVEDPEVWLATHYEDEYLWYCIKPDNTVLWD